MKESSLHLALKQAYAGKEGQTEVPVAGYLVDVVIGGLLIEVQTGSFSALRPKLADLLPDHPLRVVYPISAIKWIRKLEHPGAHSGTRRKSPRRGQFHDLFWELMRIPMHASHPNFSLEVLLIHEEELRIHDGAGSWRRKGWSISDRKLLEIVDRRLYRTPADYLEFLPASLPDLFTVRELQAAAGMPGHLARRMAYTLRKMDILPLAPRQGRAYLYRYPNRGLIT